MRKVTVFLMGGFGNCLFQLNQAYSLRSYGLDVEISTALISSSKLHRLLGWSVHDIPALDSLLRGFNVSNSLTLWQCIYLAAIFAAKKLSIADFQNVRSADKVGRYLIGYWQKGVVVNEELLSSLRKELLDSGGCQVVRNVIHARRGDFSEHIRLPLQYYVDALQSQGITRATVVTDTPDFVEELREATVGSGIAISLHRGLDMLEDFRVLANASVLISSNSTFCFWASQLVPAKKLIFPDRIAPCVPWTWPLGNPASERVSCSGFWD